MYICRLHTGRQTGDGDQGLHKGALGQTVSDTGNHALRGPQGQAVKDDPTKTTQEGLEQHWVILKEHQTTGVVVGTNRDGVAEQVLIVPQYADCSEYLPS